ncbi:MAG: hypothetical protein MHM6MM_000049 [Cercozoa sp. M6MM]
MDVRIYVILAAGVILRLLAWLGQHDTLAERPELVTPLTAQRRFAEAAFLVGEDAAEYSGVAPLPLALYTALTRVLGDHQVRVVWSLLSLVMETVVIWLVATLAVRQSAEWPRGHRQSRVAPSFRLVAACLALHPLGVLNGASGTELPNLLARALLLGTVLTSLRWRHCTAGAALSGALAALTLLCDASMLLPLLSVPVVLVTQARAQGQDETVTQETPSSVAPTDQEKRLLEQCLAADQQALSLFQQNKTSAVSRVHPKAKTVAAVFVLSTLAAFACFGALLSAAICSSSFCFLDAYYCFVLRVDEIAPGISVWWYFLMEVFRRFRGFFLFVFHSHCFVYFVPLVVRFWRRPVFLFAVLVAISRIFRPFPVLGDYAFAHTLLLTHMPLFTRMRSILPHVIAVMVALILGAFLFPAWQTTRNANFYYIQGLVFLCSHILMLQETLVSARLVLGQATQETLRSFRSLFPQCFDSNVVTEGADDADDGADDRKHN